MDDKTRLAVAMFASKFKQVDEFFLLPWRDVSRDEKPASDCEGFAWSVAKVVAGGSLKVALLRMVTFRSVMWRGWSDKSGWFPRHAALWVSGEGWIDSNDKRFRPDTGENYTKLYPVGTPFVLFGLYCLYKAKQWGLI